MAKNEKPNIVVLAAGLGTRMKSRTPKVLHKICEKPILWWVLRTVSYLKPSKTVVVLGYRIDDVRGEILNWKDEIGAFKVARQKKQLGSGDALKSAAAFIPKKGCSIVISGDVPLINANTLRKLLNYHKKSFCSATVLSAEVENPYGYGRIVRDGAGEFIRIAEEKDASDEERRITEVNSGIYCFSNDALWDALKKIRPLNKKKEYYLTDVIEILKKEGRKVAAVSFASSDEILGINDRRELAKVEKILRLKINDAHAKNGVTFIDPENTYIGPGVKIGSDTTIYPNVFIKEKTTIGQNCVIGSGCYISNSKIGEKVKIRCSYIYDSKIESGVKIGPFAHLRPGTVVKRNARIGNFTEIKNSFIGEDTKVSHLAYVGDAHLEEDINIGAGAITCNYDGVSKNKTYIGRGSFIGSNVNLIAPIKVGRNVLIGAGSTITKDITDNMLAIERGKQIIKARKK